MAQFDQEIMIAERQMRVFSRLVQTERWQSVATDKSMATYEVKHYLFKAPMMGEDLEYYRDAIKPNIPWADDHFEKDRISGEPLNPGETWGRWPYAHSANKFRNEHGQFNHSYAERYWPKFAGLTPEGKVVKGVWLDDQAHQGIRGRYGDLSDVVHLLAREPHTRQAILPVFFPEDTGAVHKGRVPCSLFYQFFLRDGELDISYTIRSCDMVRHFRDDIYLTIRLLLWVLNECRKINPAFNEVRPGTFVMLITSLHMFVNDYHTKWGAHPRSPQ